MAQTVKSLPAALGQEEPLEKGMATQFFPGEFHRQTSLVAIVSPWSRKELDMTEVTLHFHTAIW